jgi:hypothetical protein
MLATAEVLAAKEFLDLQGLSLGTLLINTII